MPFLKSEITDVVWVRSIGVSVDVTGTFGGEDQDIIPDYSGTDLLSVGASVQAGSLPGATLYLEQKAQSSVSLEDNVLTFSGAMISDQDVFGAPASGTLSINGHATDYVF